MSPSSSRREVLSLSGALAGAALAGCLGEASPGDPQPIVSDETLSALVHSNAAFALALHRELAAGSDESNVLASPHSVSVAMAMLFAGARGETEREMAETMRYELPQETLHPAIEALSGALDRRAADAADLGLLDRLRGREATFDLSVANALWGDEAYPYREEYLTVLDDHYGAGLRQVDFADSEATRAEINDWVAGETNDRIEEVLPTGSIRPNTHLVVTNAIHLLADWATQFDPTDTSEGEFTALDGTNTTVPMMRQKAEFPAAVADGVSLVELPYVGEELSMVVVVPGESVEFERFEADLTVDRLDGLLSELETSEVEVVLPRFEFGFDAHLNGVLAGLGMERAFDLGRAEFGGMTDATVAIADVFHESYVAVDEAGTEAAAATAASGADSAPPRVLADRPFLFLIRDRPTGAILFLGRVGDAGALA